MNSLDDPIISTKTYDHEIFHQNPNIVFATNNHGGHIGYMESVFKFENWHNKVALDFFDAYLES